MIHPLVRKEWREHRWVLVAMWALCLLALPVLLLGATRSGSPVGAYRPLLLVFGILLSLALGNRLVVREYSGRTQLFLETLPVSRAQVLAVKWLVGFVWLLLPMLAGLAIVLLVASASVELTPRFVLLLALRGAVFLLFCHALAFLVGLTGRYRHVVWLVMIGTAIAVDALAQLPIQQWPPLQLVSTSMPFEREAMPGQALWITGAITLVLVAAAFALALGFQGSWVVALSRRMSLREKVTTGAVLLSGLYLVFQIDSRKPKPPFTLQNAEVSGGMLPKVMVARVSGINNAAAANLATMVAIDLRELEQFLELVELPPVAVIPDATLDPDLFMAAELPDSDGVVVSGALGVEGFDEAGLRAFVVAQVLDWYTRGHARREDRRWLLDGFSRWWVARDDPEQQQLLERRAVAAARLESAVSSTSAGVVLQEWLGARERLGECLGEALAWQATSLLANDLGEEGLRSVVRTSIGRRSQPGGLALLRQAEAPDAQSLSGSLFEAMRGEVAADTAQSAPTLDWSVRFEAAPMRGRTYELHYLVDAADAPTVLPFAVRYRRIGPWEGELSRAGLERVDALESGTLPTSFAQGERVFAAVEVRDPALACTVRLGARRLEVP